MFISFSKMMGKTGIRFGYHKRITKKNAPYMILFLFVYYIFVLIVYMVMFIVWLYYLAFYGLVKLIKWIYHKVKAKKNAQPASSSGIVMEEGSHEEN